MFYGPYGYPLPDTATYVPASRYCAECGRDDLHDTTCTVWHADARRLLKELRLV